jgi:predicted lipoprotein with Yx(FWY)xxD motif/plastocyanin
MMKKAFTRTILIRGSWILSLLAVVHFTADGQTSHAVSVTSNVFTPDEITITVGDTVIWTNSQGSHNVNGRQSTFPSNPESFGNDAGMDWVFSHVFTIPGIYNYQCDPHASFGMVGKVIVEELSPDTLTVNFSGMTPHVGQNLWLAVIDDDSKDEIARITEVVTASFSIAIPGIESGKSYTIEFFSDHNGNGYYDAPPADHAWRLELNNASGNEVLDFSHNTNFTDIKWEHRVAVNLSGMTPHVGQEIYFALVDADEGEIIDRKSEIVEESFTVDLREIRPGKSYYVDFFADHNGNGYYDAPPADHAWRLEIVSASGDEVLDFSHNTNFTDIMWKHRLRVRLSGMNPHMGQMLTLFVREIPSGIYLDTVVVAQIEDADFDVRSYVIETGNSYLVDFYADHNGNGKYDAPPVDHAWRIETGQAMGDVDVAFVHNTNFTDISSSSGPHVRLAEDPELGTILTDAEGYTLYYFTKDALPETSLCTGGCVTNWPLFYAADLEVGEGLDSADFSSIEHPEGGMQTTYKGWPLYYYINDLNPGETNGEVVGNVWFVAKPDYSIMLIDNILVGKDGVTYNSNYEPGEEVVQYFVDEYGMTLYIFVNDTYNQNNYTKPDFSNNAVWPIYEEELQRVASTLDTALFGSIDVFGHQQLTYNGWPLYYYGGDSLRGNTTGVSVPNPGIWPVAVKSLEAPSVTSVDDFNVNSGLQLYPNPAINELHIISDEIIESVSLISVTGARVLTIKDVQSAEWVISLDGIGAGIYFVEVRSIDHAIQVNRLVKR